MNIALGALWAGMHPPMVKKGLVFLPASNTWVCYWPLHVARMAQLLRDLYHTLQVGPRP